ncbi:MAG: hypothetical protein GY822_07050 [Deltaproteobacteria bacterium]|nr:hypothetical protein [Deltaproteobacteria bacterium]
MRALVYSDLHLEMADCTPPRDVDLAVDVVLLLGDIHVGTKGIEWAKKNFSVPVLYVLGNHEYYGGAFPRTLDKCRAEDAGSHVQILDRDEVIIGDVRFLGATLWTDFALFGEGGQLRAMEEARFRMNDFHKIRHYFFLSKAHAPRCAQGMFCIKSLFTKGPRRTFYN